MIECILGLLKEGFDGKFWTNGFIEYFLASGVYCVGVWWALQSIRLDKLLKPNHVFQARLTLYIVGYYHWIIS